MTQGTKREEGLGEDAGVALVVSILALGAAYGMYQGALHLHAPDAPLVPLDPLALFGIFCGAAFVTLFVGALCEMIPALPTPEGQSTVRLLLLLDPLFWGGLCLVLWSAQAMAIDERFASLDSLPASVVDVETSTTTTSVRTGGGAVVPSTSTHYVLILEYEVEGISERGHHGVERAEYRRYERAKLPLPYPERVVPSPTDRTRIRVTEGGALEQRSSPMVAASIGPLLCLLGLWLAWRFWDAGASRSSPGR